MEQAYLSNFKDKQLTKMSAKIGEIVFPGDIIKDLNTIKGIAVVGPGLRRSEEPNQLIVTKPGKLCHKPSNVYWVESLHKRYVPKKGDLVVGVVTKKGGDILKVDIGSAEFASLSVFAFEGATKKQKPDLQVGDAVYAKLLSAHREMEPELVCVDKYFKAGNLGPLPSDGFIVSLAPSSVHQLLNPENPLLRTLGKKFPFEVAIGMNGKMWINTKSCKDTLTLMKAIFAAQRQSDVEIANLCRQY